MKKITAMLMGALMVVGLVGCGAKGDNLVGTWKTEYDVTSYVEEALVDLVGEDESYEFDKLLLDVEMTFKEDGTYSLGVPEDSAKKLVEDMSSIVKDATLTMLESEIESYELDMTVEEVLEMSGTSLDELYAQIDDELGEDAYKDLVNEIKVEGKYKAKDGKLYITDDVESDVEEDYCETYELKDGKLVITGNSENEEMGFGEFEYPLEFKKVK